MGTVGLATTKIIASIIEPSDELIETNMPTYVNTSPIVEEVVKLDDLANYLYIKDIKIISASTSFIGNFETLSTIFPLDRLIKTLESYKSLEEDWDGYGGMTPSTEVVDTAINLVYKIKRDDLPTPKPMVSGLGNVGLYWDGKNSYVEVGIDGVDSYYTYMSRGKTYGGEDKNMLKEPFPDALVKALKNLSV